MQTDGCVYLVGGGPGDPGLLTLRAAALLRRADVVVFDRLANERLLEHAGPNARRIYVGKQAGHHQHSQADINEILISYARAGRAVVRLKGGDPCVFGRGSEEAASLAQAGVRFEITPGVTAGLAAAVYAGIPLTDRRLSSAVALVTAREDPAKDEPGLDYRVLAGWKGTLVFYMGVGAMADTCRKLAENGMAADTPAAVVSNGTLGSQRTIQGTLGDIAGRAAGADVQPPAVLIVGPTVALRDKLNWFESRPLFGRRIVNTRAIGQAAELTERLEELGADVIPMAAIMFEPPRDPAPIRQAVRQLDQYGWIIFASANGVDALFGYLLEAGLDARALAQCKVCAIGPATARQLATYGIRPDAQPPQHEGAAIVELLASRGELAGQRVLCPRPEHAAAALVEGLTARGAAVEQVVAYRTVPDNARMDVVRKDLLAGRIHWVTFTSASAATSFFKDIRPQELRGRVKLACIGPSTSNALRAMDLEPTVEARDHTAGGLADAILEAEGP